MPALNVNNLLTNPGNGLFVGTSFQSSSPENKQVLDSALQEALKGASTGDDGIGSLLLPEHVSKLFLAGDAKRTLNAEDYLPVNQRGVVQSFLKSSAVTNSERSVVGQVLIRFADANGVAMDTDEFSGDERGFIDKNPNGAIVFLAMATSYHGGGQNVPRSDRALVHHLANDPAWSVPERITDAMHAELEIPADLQNQQGMAGILFGIQYKANQIRNAAKGTEEWTQNYVSIVNVSK
jgi:hypothetical protein